MTVAVAKTQVRQQEPLETELLLRLKPRHQSVLKGTVNTIQPPQISTESVHIREGRCYLLKWLISAPLACDTHRFSIL